QDNNATARLFSAATLQFFASNLGEHPECHGAIVYLFIFGECCDAYQNRHIPHSERLNMVLCAHYFLQLWTQFLEKSEHYKTLQNCIFHEALDIFRIIIEGLISLILVYQDFYPNYPLVPHLHSTEVCEHVFGLAQKRKPNFNMLDFLQIIPVLLLQVCEASLNASASESNANMTARAASYHHTYMDMQELNLAALSCYPSDSKIKDINFCSWEEAMGIWSDLLGVSPQSFEFSSLGTRNVEDEEFEE
ncbi:hypothetical protein BDP27DRAFT_1228794, partial [Rhodocollybia butyracea]